MRISVVVPVKDEQATLEELADGIIKAARGSADSVEVIFVDDGSQDDSWRIMSALARRKPANVKAVRLRRNFGKSVALGAGFRACTGDVIFTMDADLQDDPKEIPRFVEALDGGFDLVSGWKRVRNDPVSKTAPSRLFNRVTAWVSGVSLHDFNCGFKAYRREVIDRLRIYGDLHRYIPVVAHDMGFRIGEIAVEHHPRRHGVSKYGIERYVRGFLDLLAILATTRYLQRPGHFFGGVGMVFGLLGTLILGYLSFRWLLGQEIGGRPLFFLGFLLMILSVQLVSLGIVAEMLIRLSTPRDIGDLVAEQVNTNGGAVAAEVPRELGAVG